MTRAEMADVLDHIFVGAPDGRANEALTGAAAELRKTCDVCLYYSRQIAYGGKRLCTSWGGGFGTPADGYCYQWESK